MKWFRAKRIVALTLITALLAACGTTEPLAQMCIRDRVKAVTVEGVAASEATVQDGTYKIQRPFVFVTKEGAALSLSLIHI